MSEKTALFWHGERIEPDEYYDIYKTILDRRMDFAQGDEERRQLLSEGPLSEDEVDQTVFYDALLELIDVMGLRESVGCYLIGDEDVDGGVALFPKGHFRSALVWDGLSQEQLTRPELGDDHPYWKLFDALFAPAYPRKLATFFGAE